jgi:hypothetical protein
LPSLFIDADHDSSLDTALYHNIITPLSGEVTLHNIITPLSGEVTLYNIVTPLSGEVTLHNIVTPPSDEVTMHNIITPPSGGVILCCLHDVLHSYKWVSKSIHLSIAMLPE